jgi:hypothetical protein
VAVIASYSSLFSLQRLKPLLVPCFFRHGRADDDQLLAQSRQTSIDGRDLEAQHVCSASLSDIDLLSYDKSIIDFNSEITNCNVARACSREVLCPLFRPERTM